MTLKKIAERAGVSVSTVSRVINGKNTKAASSQVQERIFAIARELSYVPNQNAQNLKQASPNNQASSKTLGLMFGRVSAIETNPFFSILARSIEKQIIKKGYTLKYSFAVFDDQDESQFLANLETAQLDGIFVLGRLEKNYYKRIQAITKHMVYTGLNGISPEFDQVIVDGYSAAMTAVHHLYLNGHRKIGYMGEKSNESRYKGYFDAMLELDLEVDPHMVCMTKMSTDSGYTAAKKLLNKGSLSVTAFFCANDLTAIGAIKAFGEAGIHIPSELSIIGIDDIETAQLITPSLSTIHIPLEEMGRVAAKLLFDRIEDGGNLSLKIELPYTLLQRESVASLDSITK